MKQQEWKKSINLTKSSILKKTPKTYPERFDHYILNSCSGMLLADADLEKTLFFFNLLHIRTELRKKHG
jgi:hypothetical protein